LCLGLGLRLGLGFYVTWQRPYANPSAASLSPDQFNQPGLPNGKITSAVLLPQMEKLALPC